MTAVRVAVLLRLAAAVAGIALAACERRAPGSRGPAPAAVSAPDPRAARSSTAARAAVMVPPAPAPATSIVRLPPVPPVPAGLLARAAGARALVRDGCTPAAGAGAGDASSADGTCAEPREAVEIHWHVSDEP